MNHTRYFSLVTKTFVSNLQVSFYKGANGVVIFSFLALELSECTFGKIIQLLSFAPNPKYCSRAAFASVYSTSWLAHFLTIIKIFSASN